MKGSLPIPDTALKYATTQPKKVEKYTDLTDGIFDMLDCIGPMLSLDPLLMAKMVRIGRMFFHEVGHTTRMPDCDAIFKLVYF